MAQCRGVTKKGDRCKRDAKEGAEFCAIHLDQEVRKRETPPSKEEWDRDDILKAALGFAVLGAIFFFRFRK